MNQTNPAEALSAPPLPSGSKVEHRIDIAVPADFVWQLLEQVDDWPSWNPIYQQAGGSIGLGDTLTLFVAIPGIKAQNVVATVSLSMPAAHLRYGSPGMAGLIRATRFVDIEPNGPQACTVANGEVMGGALGGLIGRAMGPKIREGLRQMNEGLKAAAERQWRDHS